MTRHIAKRANFIYRIQSYLQLIYIDYFGTCHFTIAYAMSILNQSLITYYLSTAPYLHILTAHFHILPLLYHVTLDNICLEQDAISEFLLTSQEK